jgi:hypothetical protein
MEARSQLRHRPSRKCSCINLSTARGHRPLGGVRFAKLRFALQDSRQPAQQGGAIAPECAPLHAGQGCGPQRPEFFQDRAAPHRVREIIHRPVESLGGTEHGAQLGHSQRLGDRRYRQKFVLRPALVGLEVRQIQIVKSRYRDDCFDRFSDQREHPARPLWSR